MKISQTGSDAPAQTPPTPPTPSPPPVTPPDGIPTPLDRSTHTYSFFFCETLPTKFELKMVHCKDLKNQSKSSQASPSQTMY